MIVSDPPSSMLRAAPKNFFGGYSAVESTPPDMIRPDVGADRLYARARRVIPSSTMTTSVPISTSRFARSIASSATCVCSSAGRSNVLATTSPRSTWRRMSVTSSGRSSTSSTMRCTSGLLRSTEYTSCLRMVVLPAFGGDTMSPRWPLPTGEMRSTIRPVISCGSSRSSSGSFESGKSGVRSSNRGRLRASSGVSPLMSSTRRSAGYFSLLACGREAPRTRSPLRSANRRTCDADT